MDEEARELTAKMLKKRLFAMLRTTVVPAAKEGRLSSHLKWMIAGEKNGHIFASGPFVAPSALLGEGRSLTLIRAPSVEQAKAIADQDPFVIAGAVAYELFEWQLNEGGFSVTLNFSDCTYRLD